MTPLLPQKKLRPMGFKRPGTNWCKSGHCHRSHGETRYCNWLLKRFKAGANIGFRTDASVDLPSIGKRWIIDFCEKLGGGRIRYHEAKPWRRLDDNTRQKIAAFQKDHHGVEIYLNRKPLLFTVHVPGAVDKPRQQKRKPAFRKKYCKTLKRFITVKVAA